MSARPFIGALFLWVAFVPHDSRADVEQRAGSRLSLLKVPPSLQTVENDRLAKNYEGTRCVDFRNRATRIDLGTACESSSQQFLKDMGVLMPTDGVRTAEASLDDAVVATPVAQYKLVDVAGLDGKTAKVDCDTSSKAVYRPTATCQVYVARTGLETYLYGSFVLQDHASRKKGLPVKTMTDIWRQLQGVSPVESKR